VIRETFRDDLDDPTALKGNSVFAMATDRQGRLWVATTSAGLQYSDSQDFEVVHFVHRYGDSASLLNNEINHLLVDGRGFVWAATNDGISRMNPADGSCRNLYGRRHLSVLSLSEDKKGRIYATTYGGGVYVIDSATCAELGHFSGDEAEIFGKGFYVFASFADSDGDIWFGGVKGRIVCYSPENNTFRTYGAHPVFCFAEKSSGIILAGGGDGLIAIDKKSGAEETVLSDNVVQQILMDGNVMWLCTSGNGIIGIDTKSGSSSSITVSDGLLSNFTKSVVKSDGKLWIGTARGLGCYDIKARKMLALPGKDILTGNAFRENSQCKLHDGRIAFGTNNGIVAFDPESILAFKSFGKIHISDIRLLGRSIRSDSDFDLKVPVDSLNGLTLDYPHNSFTLSLLPLGNVGSNVSYSWKLEGLDREWSELSPVPLINYVNLKPGDYNLKIRMYDGGMVSEREFQFAVRPPFWQTLWFRLVVVMVAAMLIVFLARHYIRGVRRKAAFEKILLAYQISSGSSRRMGIGMKEVEESGYIDVSKECESGKKVEDVVATEVDDAETERRKEKQSESKAMDEAFLARAMECVRQNITNESFGKGEFASAMVISQSLLYKKIKAITDMSVVEFIRSIRLNHAMTLLRSGKYNVTEVSEMCGFSSSAYFSRVFKDGFGKSPSEMIPKKDSSESCENETV
ncbi:MAG: helix-turn-helix domain-containing protein, partial [Muribaculaceae bacterium]|nr:helix-turn-helix domain-containing protein [Muribaculaceae bacterium]